MTEPPPTKKRGFLATGIRGGALGCIGFLTFVVIGIIVLFVLIAACSGSGDKYAAEPTAACLRDEGAQVQVGAEHVDYIAQSAAEGALRATFGRNEAIIAFERTGGDAEDTAAAYEPFGVDGEKLVQQGNVVVAWSHSPTELERKTVEGCLS